MLYPVITQANVERGLWEKERSRAGNATFTMDKSSDAMNAPERGDGEHGPAVPGCPGGNAGNRG